MYRKDRFHQFVPSLMVEFRKRFTEEVLAEINEMIIRYNTPDKPDKPNGDSKVPEEKKPEEEAPNAGTMILDATCAPQNITFPQDINRWCYWFSYRYGY